LGDSMANTLFVVSEGARLAVDVHGDGSPQVLLCHGGPGCPEGFSEVVAILTGLGISCATFDQRGVHRSANVDGRWNLDAYANDVDAIRQYFGMDRIVVFGHSWGGVVARAWAKKFPAHVRGVLLASPSAVIGQDWAGMEKHLLGYLRARVTGSQWSEIGMWSLLSLLPFSSLADRGASEMFSRVIVAYTGNPESGKEEWIRHCSAHAANMTRRAIKQEPVDALHGLGLPADAPARAIFGDDDIYGAELVDKFQRDHLDIDTMIVAKCGHVLWHDQPKAFEDWLLDGLDACGLIAKSKTKTK